MLILYLKSIENILMKVLKMIRDIIVKVHYVADDDLLKSGAIAMTPPEDVEKYLKLDLEEIFGAEGYRGMEIRVEDTEVV